MTAAEHHTRRRDGRVPNLLAGCRPVSRRRFLELLAGAGAGALAIPLIVDSGHAPAVAAVGPPLPPGYLPTFPDGVIAGDPLPDGSVIWTRVGRPAGGDDVPLLWEVATDDSFSSIAAGGVVTVGGSDNHSAKVPVGGLDPDRWYWYRFTAGTTSGPVGRLRTSPPAGATPDRLKFAWCSCQQRNKSLYNAHTAMMNDGDLDFWMHLGDYIYVHDSATLSLDDYRNRWAEFKQNDRLQALQANLPLVATWDDGEFYNGVDRTGDPTRLATARKVWLKTMPVMAQPGDGDRIYRDFAWGNLADVLMIDTRQYRDPAVEASNDTRTPEGAVMLAEGRTSLGATQRTWLKERLAATPAIWRLLGNSYNMLPVRVEDLDPGPPRPPGVKQNEGVYFANEAWDDYAAERRELLQHLVDQGIPNMISVSGHTHVWLAGHLIPDYDDPASPLAAFDFTCGSLTADPDLLEEGLPTPPSETRTLYRNLEKAGIAINPWLTHINFIEQGYATIEVTPEEAVIEYKLIDTYDPDAEPWVGMRFRIRSGETGMTIQGFGDLTFQESPLATTTTTTTGATGSTPPSSTATTPSSAAPSSTPATRPSTANPSFTG